MLLSIVLFSVMDGIAKYLSGDYPTAMIMWVRHMAQCVFVLGLIMRARHFRVARSRRPAFQVGRAMCNIAQAFLFIFALAFVPLADAVAIAMVGPLMLTALSALLLNEQVGIRRWSAVAVGFAGALIMVRPGLGVVHWAATLVIAAAFINALFQIGTRMVSEYDDVLTTLFYTTATGAVITTAIVPFFWAEMSLEAWLMLVSMGVLGGSAHFATNRAFAEAPASILAPMSYAAIPFAAVIGYVWFHQFPDEWTILGALVVVASGLYVIYRERVSDLPGAGEEARARSGRLRPSFRRFRTSNAIRHGQASRRLTRHNGFRPQPGGALGNHAHSMRRDRAPTTVSSPINHRTLVKSR